MNEPPIIYPLTKVIPDKGELLDNNNSSYLNMENTPLGSSITKYFMHLETPVPEAPAATTTLAQLINLDEMTYNNQQQQQVIYYTIPPQQQEQQQPQLSLSNDASSLYQIIITNTNGTTSHLDDKIQQEQLLPTTTTTTTTIPSESEQVVINQEQISKELCMALEEQLPSLPDTDDHHDTEIGLNSASENVSLFTTKSNNHYDFVELNSLKIHDIQTTGGASFNKWSNCRLKQTFKSIPQFSVHDAIELDRVVCMFGVQLDNFTQTEQTTKEHLLQCYNNLVISLREFNNRDVQPPTTHDTCTHSNSVITVPKNSNILLVANDNVTCYVKNRHIIPIHFVKDACYCIRNNTGNLKIDCTNSEISFMHLTEYVNDLDIITHNVTFPIYKIETKNEQRNLLALNVPFKQTFHKFLFAHSVFYTVMHLKNDNLFLAINEMCFVENEQLLDELNIVISKRPSSSSSNDTFSVIFYKQY
uniref:Uncharacterized protein n=1 Tax=Drosophila-associated filamentous virus TaxID=2743186 RepID=A0A6M9U043_9VIRU|nr:putative protein 21 [Drosophila-associated filamentous virus]